MFSLFSSKKTPLIIAFSGGPDSVFLAEKLLSDEYENCVIAHFNHHMEMRDGDNIDDEIFAKNYAKEKKIPFELGHWENPKQSENEARNARYKFLESVREKYKAKAIVTAHHKNDVAETVLLQFFRSGGLKSLTGIESFCEIRKFWRPLLHLEKKEILEFLNNKNIDFCTDSSNKETVFLRNFLRNDAIPLLEKRFPNLQTHIASQANIFRDIDEEIEEKAKIFLSLQKKDKTGKIIEMKRENFLQEMKCVQVSILRMILEKKALSASFIQVFLDFMRNAQSGKKLETKFQIFQMRKDTLFLYEK